MDKGIAASFTGATPTIAPYGDTDGTNNALPEETEDNEDGSARRNLWMAQDIVVTFLGTSSGGGPTRTRNCSSLIVDTLGNGTLWSACYPSHQQILHRIPTTHPSLVYAL